MEFKLTITASPELLNILSGITGALGSKFQANSQTQSHEVNTNQIGQGQTQPQIIPNASVPVPTVNNQPVIGQAPINQQPGIPNQTGVVPVTNVQNINPTPVTQPQPTAPIPTGVQEYNMDQLAVAATQLVDAGRRNELVGLLSSFGVQALTALPKEQYGAFATQLRAMGARI